MPKKKSKGPPPGVLEELRRLRRLSGEIKAEEASFKAELKKRVVSVPMPVRIANEKKKKKLYEDALKDLRERNRRRQTVRRLASASKTARKLV